MAGRRRAADRITRQRALYQQKHDAQTSPNGRIGAKVDHLRARLAAEPADVQQAISEQFGRQVDHIIDALNSRRRKGAHR